MSRNNIYNDITQSLTGNQASFIPGDFYFLPNRFFLPDGLYQTTCEGKNLNIVGAKINQITAGSISFNKNEAIISTFGEYVERYCPSFYEQLDEDIIKNKSYNELTKIYSVLDFNFLGLYSDSQYKNIDFPFKPVTKETKLDWIKAFCHFSNKEIFVPCEFVFLPYRYSDKSKNNWDLTSTGLAAHTDERNALKSGYLECEERNAFCKWWYLQKQNSKKFFKYNEKSILNHYKKNRKIEHLYNNDRVNIITYDLGEYSNVETILCFIIFNYKDKEYISIGCSSKFDKEEAIIKACLEAYQGIDYAILLCNRENWLNGSDKNFNLIDGFDKHYAFYNLYPEFRDKIPIYNDLKNGKFSEIINFDDKLKSFDIEGMKKLYKDIKYLLSVNLTTPDVKALGFEVHRVIIPGFHLLTGIHKTPYLGFFETKSDLLTEYPHPFP